MVRRIRNRKRKRSEVGITGLVEPGYGAIYVRTPWMQKLKALGENTPKGVKKLRSRRK
ncbi:MAG: hypothetical protein ACFE89_12850 [Candidatus Hodarchaeota archaeon]